MRIHGTEAATANGRRVGAAVKDVADHAAALARLEIELAIVELKRKAISLEIGIGLAIVAAATAVFAIGFLLATIAAALATFLPLWLSLLIVGGGLVALAGVLAAFALTAIKRGIPVPEAALGEARATTAALRSVDEH
jgi:hypothetical protein